jgi:hypothetical protein
MDALSSFTSTSFGYLLAVILPGASAIYASSFYSRALQSIVVDVETGGSSLGLLVVVLLASAAVGLLIMPVRALVYEELIFHNQRLTADPIGTLEDAGRLQAFRVTTNSGVRCPSWCRFTP